MGLVIKQLFSYPIIYVRIYQSYKFARDKYDTISF